MDEQRRNPSRILRTLECVINATGEASVPSAVVGTAFYLALKSINATQYTMQSLSANPKIIEYDPSLSSIGFMVGAAYFAKEFIRHVVTPYDKRPKVFQFQKSASKEKSEPIYAPSYSAPV
ncbi:MAG TPA: hypothetical protein VK158_02235 [Acidobacteriota bacterium]|nr:hypothetical protein [Acidobacteriota bacterium]